MAFTDTEKAQIRRYVGRSDINRQFDLTLESAMDAISPEGEAFVRSLLVDLANIQTLLKAALACLKVSEVVGEVKLRGPEEIRALREEGNRLAREVGEALAVRTGARAFRGGVSSGQMLRG